MNNYRIGFIGAGNMSQALIAGLLDSGSVPIQSLSAADPVPATLRALSERGMLTGVNLPIAVRERDFVFLGIKPQVADAVLPQLADALIPGQVVVSMMAGVQTASIERYMGSDTPVIRVMPQTLVRLRMGACALCGGRFATARTHGPSPANLGIGWQCCRSKRSADGRRHRTIRQRSRLRICDG